MACKDETEAFVGRTVEMMGFKANETPNKVGKMTEFFEPRVPYMESI